MWSYNINFLCFVFWLYMYMYVKYVLPKIRHHDPVYLVQDGGDYENNFYYQSFLIHSTVCCQVKTSAMNLKFRPCITCRQSVKIWLFFKAFYPIQSFWLQNAFNLYFFQISWPIFNVAYPSVLDFWKIMFGKLDF